MNKNQIITKAITYIVTISILMIYGIEIVRAQDKQDNQAKFRQFIEQVVWVEIEKYKVEKHLFDRAFANARYLPAIKKAYDNQPEYKISFDKYLRRVVTKRRIEKGKQKNIDISTILDAIEVLYQIDRHIILAIWGLETSYGANRGKHNIFSSLATIAYLGSRQKFAFKQMYYALEIVRKNPEFLEFMQGSWAGAMGHTQFIPASYISYAVDFDGDRKKDIWNSIPDALGSTSNYLRKNGWNNNIPWGFQIILPDDFDYSLAGLENAHEVEFWEQKNVKRKDKTKITNYKEENDIAKMKASVVIPMGKDGVAFLVSKNFKTILTYNRSISYALAVAMLADAIKKNKS